MVVIGLVVLGILAGMFLEHVLLGIFGLWGVTQPLTRPLYNEWSFTSFIGLAIAGAIAVWVWVTPRYNEASHDVAAELKKVTWPSLAETRAATVAVIVASLIAAVLLGLFDVLWQFLTDKIQNPSL
jgi:preprotein translocase subunit SecE